MLDVIERSSWPSLEPSDLVVKSDQGIPTWQDSCESLSTNSENEFGSVPCKNNIALVADQ